MTPSAISWLEPGAARRGGRPRKPKVAWHLPAIITDPAQSATTAGLDYVTDDLPGIRRVRRGKGFSYIGLDGKPIHDRETLARIRSLAIPPAWSDVWICPLPNGHLQATGRDAKGRKQYRYHTLWGEQRNSTKYTRMLLFGAALPALRVRIEQDLNQPELSRTKVLATVLRLMELTFIRVGNREYARANKSFGLTTLRDRHAEIDGSHLRLHFRGKSGQDHEFEIKDRRLARLVKQCRDVPGYDLFQYYDENGVRNAVKSEDVNRYLREITGQDFTAKDFRTWGGTVLAARELSQMGPCEPKKAQKNVVQAIRKVANELGNRPATCRKYYVHPAMVDAYLNGTLATTFQQFDQMAPEVLPAGLSAAEAAVLSILSAQVAAEADEADGQAHEYHNPDASL